MKRYFLFIALSFLISCSSDSEPVNTPDGNVTETFNAWTPNFSNQTSNFSQTRTGSLGTQQTRTITVSSSSSTVTTTEESLSNDVNQDNDLFDEIQVTTTLYVASEGLGSFEEIEYSVLVDNNNGILIGNEFIPLEYGFIESDGNIFYCSEENEYTYFFFGLNNIGSNFSGNNYYGNGYLVESEITIDTKTLIDGFNLIPEQEYELIGGLKALSDYYGTTFSSWDDYDNWLDEYYQDSDGDYYYDLEEIFNNSDPNDSNSTPGEPYIDITFCNPETRSLEYTFTALEGYLDLSTIADGDYQGWDEIYSSSYKIVLNSDSTYSILIEGSTEGSLPVKIFFKGYLSLYDDRGSQSIAKSKKHIKPLFSKNR